jgi:hypothetical protein
MSSKRPDAPGRCPACQGETVVEADGWSRCTKCRLRFQPYTPSAEERAESREAVRQWRRLLLTVGELHRLGFEQTRIVPWIADTAGGGDWTCTLAPAAMISAENGAALDPRLAWWGGPSPLGKHFPYFIGRGWREYRPAFDSAENLLRSFPKLAEHCTGRDGDYVAWYRDMLRLTEPDGIVYASAWWGGADALPPGRLRAFNAEGKLDVRVPPPPPGMAAP